MAQATTNQHFSQQWTALEHMRKELKGQSDLVPAQSPFRCVSLAGSSKLSVLLLPYVRVTTVAAPTSQADHKEVNK